MTNEQKLTEFLKNVDDWIEDRHAELADINEEVEGIMQLTSEQVQDLDHWFGGKKITFAVGSQSQSFPVADLKMKMQYIQMK